MTAYHYQLTGKCACVKCIAELAIATILIIVVISCPRLIVAYNKVLMCMRPDRFVLCIIINIDHNLIMVINAEINRRHGVKHLCSYFGDLRHCIIQMSPDQLAVKLHML